ncbi:hypothetical protein UPYG_G00260910 [Umbra pygmaea]|uniref:Uncharacterized protein n=1 Tax=Umbra pygmaea TaxID=75934 RepID=A0ABD0W9Y6_UMBPY
MFIYFKYSTLLVHRGSCVLCLLPSEATVPIPHPHLTKRRITHQSSWKPAGRLELTGVIYLIKDHRGMLEKSHSPPFTAEGFRWSSGKGGLGGPLSPAPFRSRERQRRHHLG